MSNIDKQAVQAVADLKAGYTLGHADVAILNELARIALASLEAEPVAWLLSGGGAKNHVSFDSGNAYADPLREVTPLYTATPAPVSVPDAMEMDDDFDSAFEHGKAVGWNACRAAILQRAEPVKGWIPCSDRMPTKNHRVLIFINFNSDTVPPSIHDAQFTGSTFRRGNATVNVFPLEDGYGVTHWMPLPAAPQQGA
ncbi:DUF551 domain-containing protein [Enterobacter cloacae complex sp. 310G5]|uniref:DUF551 domain-containing protein n=1 Tax=unclassified Enterobacter cloacae complex TaxID=2757714 RepID=UPI003B5E83BB